MANPNPLPARNERSAPKWDSRYERQLPTFFEEFETVAQAAGINASDVDMKKGVMRYVDYESMKFWQTLPTFEDAASTWAEFKAEVLSQYVVKANTEDLKKVVAEFAKSGIANCQELGTYHRKFSIVAHSLRKLGILSAIQISSYYAQVFSESFRMHLEIRLRIENPTKPRDQAYSLTEVRNAAEFILSDAIAAMRAFSIGDLPSVPASTITVSSPKIELLELKVSQLTESIASLTQVVNQMVKENSKSSRPAKPTRSYSGSSKCSCDSPRFDGNWVAKGRVERDGKGIVRLKGGEGLPRTSSK